MDLNEKIDGWLPAGTRVLCIDDCINKNTGVRLFTEQYIYTVSEDNIIMSDTCFGIRFTNSPNIFAEYFIKLSPL